MEENPVWGFFIGEFIISLFAFEIWLESENQAVPPRLCHAPVKL